MLPFSRAFSSWELSHSGGCCLLSHLSGEQNLLSGLSPWAWVSGKDLGRSLQLLSMGVLPSGFQAPFLSFLPHANGGRGGEKKKVKYWDTLKSMPLPSFGFSLFLELSLHDPGFLSQLLAQGQILNLGLDNKSTAEVILTPLKRLSALWCTRNETHNSF